jgi:thioredoxin-related protein
MKLLFLLFIFLLPFVVQSEQEAKNTKDVILPEYSRVYDPARDPFADGKEALRNAKQSNRRVLIEAGGDWCSYCRILDHFIENNPAVSKALHNNFVVLKINISDENGNEEFLSGLPETTGYPHIFIAENDGRILFSRDTAQFFVNGQYSQSHFLGFLNEWGH